MQLGAAAAELLLDHIRNLLQLCEAGIPQDGEDEGCTLASLSSVGLGVVEAAIRGPTDPLQLVFDECCLLMIPRADEVEGVWKGLRQRGWDPERVLALNRFYCRRRGEATASRGALAGAP